MPVFALAVVHLIAQITQMLTEGINELILRLYLIVQCLDRLILCSQGSINETAMVDR